MNLLELDNTIALIKAKRKALGIGQKKLAKGAGVSQSFIAKLERGRIEPSYSNMVAVLNYLKQLEKKIGKKANHVMHKGIISVEPNNNVSKAEKLMKKYGISQLPVLDNGMLVGSITEDDIYKKLREGMLLKEVLNLEISDIMSDPFPTVNENTLVDSLLPLLNDTKAVIVVSPKGKPVGIITKQDMI